MGIVIYQNYLYLFCLSLYLHSFMLYIVIDTGLSNYYNNYNIIEYLHNFPQKIMLKSVISHYQSTKITVTTPKVTFLQSTQDVSITLATFLLDRTKRSLVHSVHIEKDKVKICICQLYWLSSSFTTLWYIESILSIVPIIDFRITGEIFWLLACV